MSHLRPSHRYDCACATCFQKQRSQDTPAATVVRVDSNVPALLRKPAPPKKVTR